MLALLAVLSLAQVQAAGRDAYVEYDEIRQDNRGRGNVNELNMGVVVEDGDTRRGEDVPPNLERLLRNLPEGGNINIRRIGGEPTVRE